MNTFGRLFRVSIWGESHGPAIGALIDGCPAGLPLCPQDLEEDLRRRRPGETGTTARRETDELTIESGLFEGRTTGAPILIRIANSDVRSGDYSAIARVPRPGHADLPAFHRFGGCEDFRGGGHFSGRLTAALTAAGTVARKVLLTLPVPVRCAARLVSAGGESDPARFEARIQRAADEGNPVGGVLEGTISGLEAGLGEPFFDALDGLLAHALFSIPGVKGVEFGLGFDFARLSGREVKDELVSADGTLRHNFSGGIDGGLSSGNDVIFRAAVKPAVSFGTLKSVDLTTDKPAEITPGGRHDACFARRLPPVIEAVSAIVVLDQLRLSGVVGPVLSPSTDG